MSPTLQPAPEQQPDPAALAAYAERLYSTSGGSPPAGSQATGFTAKLAYDNRAKAKLHALVLILPLAVLIFSEALRFPTEKIELPIIKLKLEVEKVLPLFLLILSYMLHRAMRYARIVLWSILYFPGQLTEVARISLDDTEAYKMNSAYYENVLDPMAALLVNLRWATARLLARVSLITFNVMIAFAVYGLIFLMLAVMAYYASSGAINLAGKLQVMQFRPHWPIDSGNTIDILVLCVSVILLALAWLNAAWIVITPTAVILLMALGLILAPIAFAREALRSGSPGRFVLGALVEYAIRLRERHRDRILARDMESYEERKNIPDEQRILEYRRRRELYDSADKLFIKSLRLKKQYGSVVLDNGEFLGSQDSEWKKVSEQYGLDDLKLCIVFLKIAAHRAPVDFVVGSAPRLAQQVSAIMDGYTLPPDETLDALLDKGSSLTLDERELASKMILARIATVPSQAEKIKDLRSRWERKISKAVTGKSRFKTDLEPLKLAIGVEEYFKQPEYMHAVFNEPPPERGRKDWKFVTRILNWLDGISTARLP